MRTAVWLCILCSGGAAADWQLDRPLPVLKQGTEFRTSLARPLSATWQQTALRDVVQGLVQTQQVALLIDGRVDPTTLINLELTAVPLKDVYDRLAQQTETQAVVVGHTIYLGPPESARWLRTQVAQHDAELDQEALQMPRSRRSGLRARKTLHWSDLATPREILDQIGQRYQLQISHVDRVPHDLWGTATLPYATTAEALSLLLTPLGLDFRWLEQGESIEIVPWQVPALIERQYTLKKSQNAAALWNNVQEQLPQLEGKIMGEQLTIRGRVEDHEAVQAILQPVKRPSSTTAMPPGSLANRKLTLQVQNVPIRRILAELEKSGAALEFDAEEFRKAGIDLETPVSLDVTQVSMAEFLTAVLSPLPVQFEVIGETIRLKPTTP
ncbi:hypothetical protein GC163_15540 [bacterium]|nr:hypothetical protein [bacterium]